MNNRMMTYRDCNYNLYTNKTPENRCIRHDVADQAGADFESPYTDFVSNRLTRFVVPDVDEGVDFCFFPFDDMYAIMNGDLTELSHSGKQPSAQQWPSMISLVPFDLTEYPMWHLDLMAAGWEYQVSNIRYEEGDAGGWILVYFEDENPAGTYYNLVGTKASFGGLWVFTKANSGSSSRKAKIIVRATRKVYTSSELAASASNSFDSDGHAIVLGGYDVATNVCLEFVLSVTQHEANYQEPDVQIASFSNSSLTTDPQEVELVFTPSPNGDVDFAVYCEESGVNTAYWTASGMHGTVSDNKYNTFASVTKNSSTKQTTIRINPVEYKTEAEGASGYINVFILATNIGCDSNKEVLPIPIITDVNCIAYNADRSEQSSQFTFSQLNSSQRAIHAYSPLTALETTIPLMKDRYSWMLQIRCRRKLGGTAPSYDTKIQWIDADSPYYNLGIASQIYPKDSNNPLSLSRPSNKRADTDRIYQAIEGHVGVLTVDFISYLFRNSNSTLHGIKVELCDQLGQHVTPTSSYVINGSYTIDSSHESVLIPITSTYFLLSINFTDQNIPTGLNPDLWFKVTQLTKLNSGINTSVSPEYAIIGFTFNE